MGGHPHVGEGMLCAVERVEDRDARRFSEPARKVGAQVVAETARRGVIARAMPQGNIVGLAPPLRLTREEADTIVGVTADAIEAVLG